MTVNDASSSPGGNIYAADTQIPWASNGQTDWLSSADAREALNVHQWLLDYWASWGLVTVLREPISSDPKNQRYRSFYRADEIASLVELSEQYGTLNTRLLRRLTEPLHNPRPEDCRVEAALIGLPWRSTREKVKWLRQIDVARRLGVTPATIGFWAYSRLLTVRWQPGTLVPGKPSRRIRKYREDEVWWLERYARRNGPITTEVLGKIVAEVESRQRSRLT